MNTIENTIELINFFHKAPAATGKNKVDFKTLNSKSVKYGYVIHPDCCTQAVDMWLDTLTENYNATFYKEWNDVLSKSRFELFIDQIIHYATTYGTDFDVDGNGYVPNDNPPQQMFKDLKVIEPITEEELYTRCMEVLKSDIALKDNTMKVMCDFIIENSNRNVSVCEIDSVRNREAQVYICSELGIFPSDEFSILRCLVYQYTNKLLLIKDRKTISTIRSKATEFDSLIRLNHPIMNLSGENIENLSRIFYRFKPILLAMKTKKTASVINRLRKLAKKNHTPLKEGFWETLISQNKNITDVMKRLDDVDNFKKVKLLQAVRVALYSNEDSKVYTIRNGKVYTRTDYSPNYDRNYLVTLETIIENSIVSSLSKKACRVRISKNYNITLPSSEKSFVGNYPFGSSIRFTRNAVAGIFWKNEWGTYDFDLSLVDFNGQKVGWNSRYYTEYGVVYSGDRTYADPHAVEAMWIENRCPDSVVYVNQFRGNPKSKFRFFVAEEEIGSTKIENRMVNQDNIRLDTMIEVDGEAQKTVGLVHDNTFYFMDLCSGNRIVSSYSDYGKKFIQTMCERTKCFVNLRDILKKAGFTEVGENEECDLDFTNLEKDTLINLLAIEK